MPLTAEVFLGARLFGAHLFFTRAPSPFLHEPYGKWGARAQKRRFACAANKIARAFLGKRDACEMLELKENQTFAERLGVRFSLFARHFGLPLLLKSRKFTFYLTQISPNETAAICRDFKTTTMFGLCPQQRFLLLWRILGLPLLKNAPNSFSFFPPPMRRKGKKSKARF